MEDVNRSPGQEQFPAWLDGELEEELRAMLDSIQVPDLTGRVMTGIEEADRRSGVLLNVISYLITAGVSLALVLAYTLVLPLISFELRPVAIVNFLTAVDRLVVFLDETVKFIAAQIIPGGPLIPPLVVALAVLMINLLGKRRLTDV